MRRHLIEGEVIEAKKGHRGELSINGLTLRNATFAKRSVDVVTVRSFQHPLRAGRIGIASVTGTFPWQDVFWDRET